MRPKPAPTPLPPGPVCEHGRNPCSTCEREDMISRIVVGLFVLCGFAAIGTMVVAIIAY